MQPVPVFEGVATLLKLVGGLYPRPRFVERFRRRSHPSDQALPLLWLVRQPGGESVLPAVANLFEEASPRRVPYGYVNAHGTGDAAGGAQTRLPLLHSLYHELAVDRFGIGRRARFDRYLLASWLTMQNLGGLAGDQARRKLIHLLRDRRGWGQADQAVLSATDAAPGLLTKLALLLFAAFWPVSRFWLWVSGRVPGLGSQTRWFMRQPFMAPSQSSDFLGFAERLTLGRRRDEDLDQIDKLLVYAFLEDLRDAYRRRPWRLHTWRRTAYTVVLLDNVSRGNGGSRLLVLVNEVRNKTGELDPLLVVASGAEQLPDWPPDHPVRPVSEAADALVRWRRDLPKQRQTQARAGWFLPLALPPQAPPQSLPPEDRNAWDRIERYEPRRAPWLARRPVAALVVLAVLALAAAPVGRTGYPYWASNCRLVDRDGVSVAPVQVTVGGVTERQCVGYSDSDRQLFGADERLRAAQRGIFAQNERAKQLHDQVPRRPLVSVVYFAGLTSQRVDAESDRAQAEEMEGLLLRQQQQNNPSKAEPLLRVIVANGGAQMKASLRVAQDMLAPLVRSDPTVLGVVGLDRSITETEQVITLLGNLGVPVVAHTLSGDGLPERSPLYFQLVPDNAYQARMVAEFVRKRRARKVTIYHPTVPGDTYVRTLVESLHRELGTLAGEDRTWSSAASGLGLRSLCEDPTDQRNDIVFYAGRHDDFEQFLKDVTRGCYGQRRLPMILTNDAASRILADEQRRRQDAFAGISVHFVSKGGLVVLAGKNCLERKPSPAIGGGTPLDAFCAGYHRLYEHLRQTLRNKPKLLWPGERVGASYDSAGLFLEAVRRNRNRVGQPTQRYVPDRAAIAQEFREMEFKGVSGSVTFGASRIAEGKNLAILKLADIYDLAAEPTCEYMVGTLYTADQPRNSATGCPTP